MHNSLPIVDEYDTHDGVDEDGDFCPHCGIVFSVHHHVGPVIDTDGTQFVTIYNTDPDNGPWFCPECWETLETNRKMLENKQLSHFVEGVHD